MKNKNKKKLSTYTFDSCSFFLISIKITLGGALTEVCSFNYFSVLRRDHNFNQLVLIEGLILNASVEINVLRVLIFVISFQQTSHAS